MNAPAEPLLTRGQVIASLLTVAMVAGMCVAVLLTTGRTVAAEQAVLAQVDSAGTRSIVVRARDDAGLTVAVLEQLRVVAGVAAVTGFGPITNARNSAFSGGSPVPVRRGYGTVGETPLHTIELAGDPAALASPAAAHLLGLADGTGGLLTDDQRGVTVAGALTVPAYLGSVEPLVVIPSSTIDSPAGSNPDDPLALLVVLAASPPEVPAVEAAVRDLLYLADPAAVTIEASAQLAAVRAAADELGTHARRTGLAILTVSAILVVVNLLVLVSTRRAGRAFR